MQKVKSVVMAGALTLFIGAAEATPATEQPPVLSKKMQKVVDDVVSGKSEKGQNTQSAVAATPKAQANASGSVVAKQEPFQSSMEDKDPLVPSGDAEQDKADNTASIQDRLASMAEDDYAFEQMRRKLANLVELEKLRSEIVKLRGEDKIKTTPATSASASKGQISASARSETPRVVLEADIGGANRVAVMSGNTLSYVRPGETFTVGNIKYKLSKDRKSVVMAEDAVQ